jgi:hypothetical protein
MVAMSCHNNRSSSKAAERVSSDKMMLVTVWKEIGKLNRLARNTNGEDCVGPAIHDPVRI